MGKDTGLIYDDDTKLVQIGFDFVFYDAVETQVYVDTNGNLHFLTSESYGYGYNSGPIPTQYAEQPRMIAPFFEDLEPYPPDGSKIYVNLIGEPPGRRFVVTWFNIPFYSPGVPGNGPYNTFQVQLFEGSNQIQFGYNGLIGGANVGLARDNAEYLAADWSQDSLDGKNICYYPEDDGTYDEVPGPCAPCPDRPWFREVSFRDQLKELWESSNPVIPGEDPSLTTERGAWIFEQGGSHELVTEGVEPAIEYGGCATDWEEPPPPAGTLVAMVHTHPWATGSYDGICGRSTGISVDQESPLMTPEDVFKADSFKLRYGLRFGYVIYGNGGVLEYEPVQVQFGPYPRCLQ